MTPIVPFARRLPARLALGSALAGLLLVGLPAKTRAEQAPPGARILVMPFAVEVEPDAPGGQAVGLWLGEAAALLLAEGLAGRGFGALSRAERVEAFERLRLPMSARLTRATMIRVGELLGASEVISGDIRLGTELTVRARTVHLEAARQLPEVTVRGALADLIPLFGQVAGRIAGGSLPAADATAAAHPELPLEVFENYVKGLVAATPAAQRRFLELALAEAPRDGRILMALWDVYTAEGAHELALGAASAVPARDPLFRRARFLVAVSLLDLRRFDGAARELAGLDGTSGEAAVANALGVAALRRTVPDYPTAIAAFARAVQAAPADTAYLFNLGYAHARAGDAGQALGWLREVVRLDAADGDAHLVMSAMLAVTGRPTEARRELDLARLLGSTVDLTGRAVGPAVPAGLDRVVLTFDRPGVMGEPPARPRPGTADQAAAAYHLEQGRRLMEAQKDREAVAELRRAVYLAPYADEPHLLLGRLYRRAGRLDDAIDEFKVAIWSRETVAARVALAEAFLEAGSLDDARREAARARQLAPDDPEVQALLARIGGETAARRWRRVTISQAACPTRRFGKSS